MGRSGMGVLDSARTDSRGTYQLPVNHPDTTVQYVVSTRYAGVGYLSGTVGPGPVISQRLDTITVFDTTTAEPITLSQRHLLIQPPNPDGSIPVLELLVLRNAGTRARIAIDSTRPTWQTRLLPGATDSEVGESDINQSAIAHHGDTIAVEGPITPGEKQVVVTYLLPRGQTEIQVPVDQPIETFGIMVSDTLAHAAGALRETGVSTFESIPYRRFEGSNIPANASIVVRLTRPAPTPGDLWWVVIALAALGMAAAFVTWWRVRNPQSAIPHPQLSEPELLALRIAALDVALESRDDPAGTTRREELKAELEATLAEGKGHR